MPLQDITNPQVIRFLKESYEKEAALRSKWTRLHMKKFENAATFRGEEKNYTETDACKVVMLSGMAATARDNIAAAKHRMTAPLPDYMLADTKTLKKDIPAMIPVNTEEKQLLHESRVKYLKQRNSESPDEKYNFIECTSWKYGWKQKESYLKIRGPAHGICAHMLRLTQNRVGPQLDPGHYKNPTSGSHMFCNGSI